MSKHRDLAVADAAEQLSVAVTRLSDRTRRLVHRQQLLKAAQSVNSNIAAGFGRETLADRNSRLVIARGEAEEPIKHLRVNLASHRITANDYWPLHNRAVTIVKMLNGLMSWRGPTRSLLGALWHLAPYGTSRSGTRAIT